MPNYPAPDDANPCESSNGSLPGSELKAVLMEVDDRKGRFEALGHGTSGQSPWRPGIIEVIFKREVEPSFIAFASSLAEPVFENLSAEATSLQALLRHHGLVRSFPTFAPKPVMEGLESLGELITASSERNRFVTYDFGTEADLGAVTHALKQLPQVERAAVVPLLAPPDVSTIDPLLGTPQDLFVDNQIDHQWYVFRCQTEHSWEIATGKGVIVADIDWGFRDTHQDLIQRITLKHNQVDGTSDVSQGKTVHHGTAVLGIAGAERNGVGIAGFAHGAELWAIQACIDPDRADPEFWRHAIDLVCDTEPDRRKVVMLEVQTATLGCIESILSINQAIKDAITRDVVVCVPAGNGNRDVGIDDLGNSIPITGSILVGATKYDALENRRADFSNFGAAVVVSAPGDIDHDVTCSSESDHAYRNQFGGTSGATPKVAGTVALMLEVNPHLTHSQIVAILRSTSTPIAGSDSKPIGSFLNTREAVREALRQA